MLVDDEPDIVFLARTLFESDGRFDVVGEASDGEEAVRLAQQLHPDAVLLDILMPGMDGWQALPLIRRVAPETAVVVVSALGQAHRFLTVGRLPHHVEAAVALEQRASQKDDVRLVVNEHHPRQGSVPIPLGSHEPKLRLVH